MNKWRQELEKKVTRELLQQHEERQAPEWVVHRVINGKTVLNTRTVKGAAWRNRRG